MDPITIDYICLRFEQDIPEIAFTDPKIAGDDDPAQILMWITNYTCHIHGGILRDKLYIVNNGSSNNLRYLSKTYQIKESLVRTEVDMGTKKVVTTITFMPEYWDKDLITMFRNAYNQEGEQTTLKNRRYEEPPYLPE